MVTSASRGLLKAVAIIGAAQVINISLSILRMKVIALLLGPSGVGLLSIFMSLQEMVTAGAGLGMASSGVRQVARERDSAAALGRIRRVMVGAHIVQGLMAMGLVWLFREQLSVLLLGDAARQDEIGLVGLGVFLALTAAGLTTLLRGLRRVGDLGRLTVLAALGTTAAGLGAVWWLGDAGLIWVVVAQPFFMAVTGWFFARRVQTETPRNLSAAVIWSTWKPMAALGFMFMLSALAMTGTLLLVRWYLTREMGLEAVGYFSAAWGVTMTYVGFLLGAMATDFYPRLTEIIDDHPAATALVNNQAQLGLAICGPVLLVLIGMAPLVIEILYSAAFAPAAEILQWQTLGNVFKIACWPLSFILVAKALGKSFLAAELTFNGSFLVFVVPMLDVVGLVATGPAFLFAYVMQFLLLSLLARRCLGYRWEGLSLVLLLLNMVLAVGLLALAYIDAMAAAIVSCVLGFGLGIFGLRIVLAKIGPDGKLPGLVAGMFARVGWPIRSDGNT